MIRRAGAALAAAAALAAGVLGSAGAAHAAPGPAGAPQYWFDDWQVPALWADGARGQGITIAEIDTGVNAALPELRGRVVTGTDLGQPGDGQTDRELDEFGHGTAMASLMVARSGLFGITGLAPRAKVLPIAVPLEGTTDADRPDRLPAAIRYAADHGAKVISMSLGERRSPDRDTVSCPADEQDAIFHALRKGAVVVAAVGNTGQAHETVVDPGVCLGVVSVGAVDSSGTVAPFSGRARYLTLTAPGVGIASLSRVAGRAYSGAGTSQATALTAAGIALVWSRFPRLTGAQVVARILATLDGRNATPDRAYGYGRLDPYQAVTATLPARLPNPVYDAAAPFLAHSAGLATASLGAAPPPAAGPRADTGRYAVHKPSRWLTPSVLIGAGAAAAGLVLLAALLAGAAIARRRRPVPDASLPAAGADPQLPGARVLSSPPDQA
ncbi:MAG TPA: S8 family serine peptidase [Jatrophihabitans sp.]|nr:S8 family serine peptidase [Jatrophihabitans sp.]